MLIQGAGAIFERAGGGHSFSGGGGGHSFSGGGGGIHTGPIFVGGGYGGGGGSAVLGIIIIGVLILIVVLFVVSKARHQTRLAGATPAPYPVSDTPAYAPGTFTSPAPSVAAGPEAGIEAIKAHDPEFNIETFKSSVERSFFVVEEAWSDLKPDMSRRVMADGLWQQHRTQIQGYQNNGTRNVLDGLAVGRIDLMSASSDDQFDTITVRILAACADYDINVASGKVVRGNKRDMENWQEDWVFQRSSKATTKAGGGTMQQKCPNCGAPLDVDLAGVCTHCRAPIMSGQYDWVLTRIDQI